MDVMDVENNDRSLLRGVRPLTSPAILYQTHNILTNIIEPQFKIIFIKRLPEFRVIWNEKQNVFQQQYFEMRKKLP